MVPTDAPDPADGLLSSYAFVLPEALIAQRPVEPRHAARLLALEAATVVDAEAAAARHLTVWDLTEDLAPGDLLVVNDTRVLRARLAARRASGGAVELLLVEPCGDGLWLCLARPAKRLRSDEVLEVVAEGEPPLPVRIEGIDQESGGRFVRFPPGCADAAAIEPLLERYGTMPLPPYIEPAEGRDDSRYQTRYAARPGAVAAPTAGLHLSDELLEALRAKGVLLATVTLHVGLGTFRPLESEDLSRLTLHNEWVEVGTDVVEAVATCRARGGRVIAVGTTCVRSLEGVAALNGGRLVPHAGPVNLVIQPGFRFAVVEGLLTNFHLPRSSLLLLVSALVGRRRLLNLYAEAIERHYRFFSFGDAMWIPPEAVLKRARPGGMAPPGA